MRKFDEQPSEKALVAGRPPGFHVAERQALAGAATSDWCLRPRATATSSQPTTRTVLASAKGRAPRPKWWPSQTIPADSTSPVRTRKVSMTAFALYFASREVGRNSV